MTSKQIYEATAIELSKVQAPSLKLYEFNYFFNQAIRQFVNKVYNVYDINLQTTDDLRVLKATATLKPQEALPTGNRAIDYLRGATYFVDMPDDYLHLLNCICLFDVRKRKECWNAGDTMIVGATKLTADSWSSVVDDVYNQPTKKRPYYYVHNQNDIHTDVLPEAPEDSEKFPTSRNSELPTNLSTDLLHSSAQLTHTVPGEVKTAFNNAVDAITGSGDSATPTYATLTAAVTLAKTAIPTTLSDAEKTDLLEAMDSWATANSSLGRDDWKTEFAKVIYVSNPNAPARTFTFYEDTTPVLYSSVEKPDGVRHANSSRVKVEIRCGRDKSNIFSLSAVQIDYVKAPQFIRLTQEQLDSDEDISQVMEFPDYVNQEIINELVNLVMRKTNDPSLSAHMLMTLSIARPTGQLQQQPAAQG